MDIRKLEIPDMRLSVARRFADRQGYFCEPFAYHVSTRKGARVVDACQLTPPT